MFPMRDDDSEFTPRYIRSVHAPLASLSPARHGTPAGCGPDME